MCSQWAAAAVGAAALDLLRQATLAVMADRAAGALDSLVLGSLLQRFQER
jgi:hypothetical protein